MSIILGVMDRNNWKATTDILIFIDSKKKIIKWIPRDLYSPLIKNRINKAYSIGGKKLLLECLTNLSELNISPKYCLCVLPLCFDLNIKKIDNINVPVEQKMKFYYPLHRFKEIEKGKRLIEFNPPFENLKNNRFHEWIGARYEVDNFTRFPDFNRIRRQQILLKALLSRKYNFIYSKQHVQGMNIKVLKILKTINETWTIEPILDSDYQSKIINKMDVLVLNKPYF